MTESNEQAPATPAAGTAWGVRMLRELGPLLALTAVVLFFAIAQFVAESSWEMQTNFATMRNFRLVLVQTATVAVAALGMTVIIMAGGIDLSVGNTMALCATVLAWLLLQEYSPTAAILGCILTGAACGLVNGLLISLLRMVPFIVTLGTMTVFLGVAKLIASETTVRPDLAVIPNWLSSLLNPREEHLYLSMPLGVWFVLLLALGLGAVLRYTVFGRYILALGSNEATARLCGIHVPALKVAVYTLAGVFVGLAGIYQFSRLSVGNPTSGIGLELKVIAAVVIGGGSLSGGQGSVLGTLAGAAIMVVIGSGCTGLGFSNSVQDVINGVIIVSAVVVDRFRQRQMTRV